MTLTKNYGLKKPDLTDPVDVGVLNENFDKIDDSLDPFYVLDLRQKISVTLPVTNVTGIETFDITSDIADLDALRAAVAAGKTIRLCITTSDAKEIGIPLSTKGMTVNDDGTYYEYSGTFSETMHFARYAATLGLNTVTDTGWLHITDLVTILGTLSVEVDETLTESGKAADAAVVGGKIAELTREATTIAVVLADNTITITTAFEDESQSVSEITLGSDDYPEKVTTDGVECAVSWEGFDTKTAELPVVELSTVVTMDGVYVDLSETESALLDATYQNKSPIVCNVTVEEIVVSVPMMYVGGTITGYSGNSNIGNLALSKTDAGWTALFEPVG